MLPQRCTLCYTQLLAISQVTATTEPTFKQAINGPVAAKWWEAINRDSVTKLAQFCTNPSPVQYAAVKRIYRSLLSFPGLDTVY